jgi:porin
VKISAGYTAEVWGNTTGGLKQGAVYTGLLDSGVTVDLEKLVDWKGASVSTTWLWLSGRDALGDLVGNFLTISNIAGFNTLRMFELWFQQDFFQRGEDERPGLSIRVGQFRAHSEFVISEYGSLFTNATFGWPAFLYTNIPGGGPGYPMGTLGVRVAVNPWKWMTLQSAVFQGNVFAQDVNRHGFKWDLNPALGYFWINELQVRWNQDSNALPGQTKFGAWFQTADFADPFFDDTGVPLADANSSGKPKLTLRITDSTGSWTKCSTASPQSRGLSPASARRWKIGRFLNGKQAKWEKALQSGSRLVRAHRFRATGSQFRRVLF